MPFSANRYVESLCSVKTRLLTSGRVQDTTVECIQTHCAEEMAAMKRTIWQQEVYHANREALHLRHSYELSQRLKGMKQQNLSLRRQLDRAG